MEPQLEQRLKDLEEKIDATYRSAEKTRKYIWTFVTISVIALVLPLIGLVFAIPNLLDTYSTMQNL
jgi:type IV secretory pathway component VirB8